MPSVSLRHPNERFDVLLRRFKKAVEKADTLRELHEREFYEKPSAIKKRAKAAAKKRAYREQQERNINRKRLF